MVVGLVLVFSPDTLVDNVDLGRDPHRRDFLIAIPVAMVAYTGIETVSNLAEEARDYGTTIPRGIGGVVVAVAVIYAFLPAVALSAMPVVNGETVLAQSKEDGGYADDPILGVVENIELGALQGAAEIYVGVLAATILFIATNAGLIGVSRLTYSMGQYRQLPGSAAPAPPELPHPVRGDPGVRRRGLPHDRARPGGLPGHDLRVRRDALVHDRPRVGVRPAHQPSRRAAAVPDPGDRAHRRPRAAPALGARGPGHRRSRS